MQRFQLLIAVCAATLTASLATSGAWAQARTQGGAPTTDLVNIAAAANGGRVLSASSIFENNAEYAPTKLIDGAAWRPGATSGSRGWASNSYDPISLETVTLGFKDNRVYNLGKIVLNPATDLNPERWAKDVEVQVSTETAEGPYTPVAQLTLRQEAKRQEFPILATPARFVRLAFRSNYGSDRAVSLGEVEIYEAIGNTDPMGSVINRLDNALDALREYRTEAGSAPAATVKAVGLATSSNPGRVNVAAQKNGGRVVAYSTLYSNDPTFGPDKLIDGEVWNPSNGKGSNGWASEGFAPDREFVTIGFGDGKTHLLGRVVMNPASNLPDLRWARRVEVQATTGDSKTGPWKPVGGFLLKTQAANQEFEFRPTEAKYVRFVFSANGPGVVLPGADPRVNSNRAVSLGEIELYEAPAQNDRLEALIGQFNGVLTDLKTLRRREMGK